ncbi:MAG: hypothetical protein Q9185_002390 [Variospora sp. 1 TL-2023]
MAQKLATTARTGRDNQSKPPPYDCRPERGEMRKPGDAALPLLILIVQAGYGAQGERLVAGVVPLSNDKTKVLLIQSTRRGGWVLPKGGWETDEGTAQEAACREAWEEAGIVCTVVKDLGTIPEMRATQELTDKAPKAAYQFYEVRVDLEASDWPEKDKRGRQWMTYLQAKQSLQTRPELLEALNRSTIIK